MKFDWDRIQVPMIWVLGSLLTIAIIGDQPYWGLAVAILSGVAVGMASILACEKMNRPK